MKIGTFFLMFLGYSTMGLAHLGASWSTLPQSEENKKFLAAEFTGDLSTEGGMGMQGRYAYKISQIQQADMGIGFGGGQRPGRIFVGYDHEIFPDYETQPRVALRGVAENERIGAVNRNKLGITPIASKGFNFWGTEGFPYVAVPIGLAFEGNKGSETYAALAVGIDGFLPFEGMKHVGVKLEGTINISNAMTGVNLGLNFPL